MIARPCSTFVLATLMCVGAAACSNSAAPRPLSAGLHVLTGAPTSDTIGANLPAPVTVILVDSNGKGIPNQPISFEDFSIAAPYVGFVLIAVPAKVPAFTSKVTVMSDNGGRASVRVQCGIFAGVAAIVISSPAAPAFDTARITVLPGAPAGVQAFPSDTAVYVGHHFTLRGTLVDQAYNPIPNSVVQYRGASPEFAISNGQLSGVSIGRGSYVVSATIGGAMHTDTGRVTVVPPGVLAATDFHHIYVFNTDGSGFRALFTGINSDLRWSASGAEIAFDQSLIGGTSSGDDGGPDSLIQAVDTIGNVRTISSPSIGGVHQGPQYSRDGQWIYFARYPGNFLGNPRGTPTLWRIHPDGSAAAPLTVSTAGSYGYPTPSPDGTQIAFQTVMQAGAPFDWGGTIRSLTVANGALSSLAIPGEGPVWSPTAGTIAYINEVGDGDDQGPIWVMAADGTSQRQVGTGSYNPSLDWSPDGQWIAAQATGGSSYDFVIEIVSVKTGKRLPLAFTGIVGGRQLTAPTWRP